MNNYAFIDGQNLHLGTRFDNWDIDLAKFRLYLLLKYKVSQAYYFLGYMSEKYVNIYKKIEDAGFTVIFREHSENAYGKKKGNVDTDIIFEICKSLIEKYEFSKIIIVSGDGDYKKLVNYLISKNKFEKILFPNKKFASSLYKSITSTYFDYLDNPDLKHKIMKK